MSKIKKVIWALTLCIFVSGCSTAYQPAVMPGEIQNYKTSWQMRAVRKGDAVRVTLHSGEEATGEVDEIGIDILTLRNKKFLGYKKRDIGVAEIDRIEIREATGGLSTAGTVIIVLVGLAVVAGIIVASQVDTSWGNSSQ